MTGAITARYPLAWAACLIDTLAHLERYGLLARVAAHQQG